MSSSLTVVTELRGDHYLITANVVAGGTLPQEIFIYENSGTDVLGDFYGTCSVDELGRFQIFSGTPIPTFGNRFIRYGQAKIIVALNDDPVAVVTALIKNVKLLSVTLQTKTNTSATYIIP